MSAGESNTVVCHLGAVRRWELVRVRQCPAGRSEMVVCQESESKTVEVGESETVSGTSE